MSPPPARVPNRPVLPRGHWGPILPQLRLDTTNHKELVGCMERILRRLLLTDYYVPVIRAHSSTCVGLALELIRRLQCLECRFPGLKATMSVFSCEESVHGVLQDSVSTDEAYELDSPDKEHVIVGIHILLNGRRGVLIADPGYHASTVVTVMEDGLIPHTGWFTHLKEGKEFRYEFSKSNPNYIIWYEDEHCNLSNLRSNLSASLIYASRFFCDAICITEKRNLVYKLKSIIGRSHTGKPIAGLFFYLCPYFDGALFSIKIGDQKLKYRFKDFLGEVDLDCLNTIEMCNAKLNFSEGRLTAIVKRLAHILSDESFVRQCIQLNTYIKQCSTISRENLWATADLQLLEDIQEQKED